MELPGEAIQQDPWRPLGYGGQGLQHHPQGQLLGEGRQASDRQPYPGLPALLAWPGHGSSQATPLPDPGVQATPGSGQLLLPPQ